MSIAARAFFFISVLREVEIGSTFSVRGFTNIHNTVSVKGNGWVEGYHSVGEYLHVGSAVSVRQYVKLGSALSVESFGQFGSHLSTFQFLKLGSTLSVRGFTHVNMLSVIDKADFKTDLLSSVPLRLARLSIRRMVRLGDGMLSLPAPASSAKVPTARCPRQPRIHG